MIAYIIRRLLLLIPLAIGMVVVTFALLLIIPGDPASVLLGQEATPEAIATLRANLGLDDPWYIRLWDYFAALAHGDMGQSIFQNEAVSTIIDTATMLLAQLGVSMPVYWLGLLLMLMFAVNLGWLPAIGRGEPLLDAIAAALSGRPEVLVKSLSHIALPAFALAVNSAAIISRLVRTSMLEILREDFIRTAYAKGLRRPRVIVRHALRNALLPVLSVIGLRFGALLGGAVLTETIFAWPGLGQLTISAISQRDLPLIQGIVLTFAIIFALVNLVVDLLYAAVDPRIRLG